MIGTDYFREIWKALENIGQLHQENFVIQREIEQVEASVRTLFTMHEAVDAEYTTRVVK